MSFDKEPDRPQEARSRALAERLRDAVPILLDSAMGTELERRGVSSRLPLWSARALLDAPGAVSAVHRENVRAGADLLTANTFRTHARSLAREGLANRSRQLTRLAMALAREAAGESGRPVFVLGSLSPLEDCYRPDLTPGPAELSREHREQAQALREAGADGILVETQNSVQELRLAVEAATSTGLPVVASVVSDGQGRLLSGERIEDAVSGIERFAAEVLSINCVPARRLANDLRRLARAAPGARLGAYGNLGPPVDSEQLHFEEEIGPEQFAGLAGEWIDLGARLVGGCCGTTPAHTAALRRLLDSRHA